MTVRSTVYLLYDADDKLLYVGSTQSPTVRYKDHARNKPWWSDVRRMKETWYDTREAAYRAERVAIRIGCPKHNIRAPLKRALTSDGK